MSPHTDPGELLKLADELRERLADAKAKATESAKVSLNSYGAGYDIGYHDALGEFLEFIEDDAAASQGRAGGARSEVQKESALADAIAVIRAEPCPFKEGPMADGWAEAWATFLNRLGDVDETKGLYANSRAAQASQELIADLQYEAGIYQSLYENAIERCAKIAEGGLVCRSCGYVGGFTECCERMDFDGASNDQIAAGIRALSVPSAHRAYPDPADRWEGWPEPPMRGGK